jgi:hypothetical protein
MLLHRKNDSRDPVDGPGRQRRWPALDPEEELRADEQPLDGSLDAQIEGTVGTSRFEKWQEVLKVSVADWSTIGPPGQRRDDPLRARPFLADGGWATHEDAPAAG